MPGYIDTTLTGMRLYYKFKRALACMLIKKQVKLGIPAPVVSFTFDDAPNSAFVTGGEILKKYGFPATYYVSMSLAGEGKEFDAGHLKKVIESGGEIGCHTFNHIALYTSGRDEVIRDLATNQEKVNEWVNGYTLRNFAYPFGQQTFESKNILRERFTSARGITHGINSGTVDLNNLKGIGLANDIVSLEEIRSLIDKTIHLKGWLIFIGHDVEDKHSAYGCTPAYLDDVAKYCHEKGLEGLTIEQMMVRLTGNNK